MLYKLSTILIFSSLILTGCFHEGANKDSINNEFQEEDKTVEVIDDGEYAVDTERSRVEWTGSRVAYSHVGTVDISEGILIFENGELTGGSFILDMQTISDEDVESQERNAMLVGHLKSADFFDVENFATSTVVITGVEKADNGSYNIKANAEIKNITNEIEFTASAAREESENSITFMADFDIDRTLWDIRFGSGKFFEDLGDQLIKDKINFSVKIAADKK